MPLQTTRGPGTDNGGTAINAIDKYFLLVIGIDHYQGGFKMLNNAVRDAARVSDILTTKYRFYLPAQVKDLRQLDQRYNDLIYADPLPVFETAQTISLYNENATKKNIIKHIDNITKQIGRDDALLIYFAGHGVRSSINQEYYLITSESEISDRSSFLSVSEIYGNFKSYLSTYKCRDLLVILDSCYAGASTLGYPGEQKEGSFSRHIITSCLPDEPADDGPRGRGSSFANAFINSLQQDQSIVVTIDEIRSKLTSKFDVDTESKLSDTQKLLFGYLPNTQNGQGSFVFEKREKNKPDILHLKESLIDYLDFKHQRGDLEEYYRKHKNNLNIITTQGQSLNVQKVLSKIIFRWISKFSAIPLQPELCYIADPVKIEKHQDDDLWRILYKQIKDESGTLRDDNHSILNWYFEKLRADDPGFNGKRHVIIWIGFQLGGAEIFERINLFCGEFSDLFLRTLATLDPAVRQHYGKMFLVFSDERAGSEDSHRNLFDQHARSNNFNFIPTRSVTNINRNHMDFWIRNFSINNLTQKIQKLTDNQYLLQWAGSEDFEFCYEEFITKVCNHCELSAPEVMQLNAYLYDFNKKSLL
jgi:hypothetical protein